MKGILVGNGVMNFEDHSLEKSQVQYMIEHNLLSQRIRYIYERACTIDYNSPRCKFTRLEIKVL